jgi:hypothetical protein
VSHISIEETHADNSSDYYTEESYGGFLGAPPIPIDGMTYNSTDGYFCVTSVLTQLSAYFGTELTVPFISSIVSGDNSTALDLVKTINPNVICNDCIFATFDILGQAVPALADVTVDSIFGALNMTSPAPAGTTLVDLAEGTCAYQNRTVTTGELHLKEICVDIRWHFARIRYRFYRQLDFHPRLRLSLANVELNICKVVKNSLNSLVWRRFICIRLLSLQYRCCVNCALRSSSAVSLIQQSQP